MRDRYSPREYHSGAHDVSGSYADDITGYGSPSRVESVLRPEHLAFPGATVRSDQEFRLPAGNRSGNEAAARGD
jgi:hypothetical protein